MPPPPPRPPYSGRGTGQSFTRQTASIPANPSEAGSFYEGPPPPPPPPSIPRRFSPARPQRVAYRGYSEAEVVGILRSLEDGRRTTRGGIDVSKTSEDGPPSPRKSTSSELTLPMDIDDTELAPEKDMEPRRSRSCRFGSAHQWIFAGILSANIMVLILVLALTFTGSYRLTYQAAMSGFTINLLFLLIVRNDHVLNAPFHFLGDRPQRIPFRVRYLFAKYYSVGGVRKFIILFSFSLFQLAPQLFALGIMTDWISLVM